MSQEKVNYKQDQKKNRKQLVQSKKRGRMIRIVIAVVVLCLLLVWIGFSIKDRYDEHKAANPDYNELSLDAITDYMSSLDESEDAETEETTEDADAEEAAEDTDAADAETEDGEAEEETEDTAEETSEDATEDVAAEAE